MSKRIAKIPLDRIEMVRVVPGQGKSLALIAGSADYVINGGFFDWGTGNAVGHLKADGKVLAKENWNCWGMRWDKGQDIRMDVVPNSGGENYISGVELLTRDLGPKGKLSYPGDVGGVRGRTAMGLAGDCLVLYCSGDGTADAKKPEALRDELVQLGCDRAIMLDSGGSSQCSFPEGEIKSARRVHNYIAVWLKKEEGEDEEVSHKVVLDPGHGVETAGKCSPDKSYYEHEFNLDVAGRVKAHLERHGVSVTLTRADEHDVTLAQRVKVANDIHDLDLFCSIHSNAYDPEGDADGDGNPVDWSDPDGYGIYTSAKSDTAGRNKAARAILARASAAGIQLWSDGLFHEGFYVLQNTVAPAVLIEHGFHTNINEVALLKHDVYRDLLAKVDAQGILDYLGIAWVEGDIPKKEEQKTEPEPTEEVVCVCPHCGGKLKIEKG